MQELSPKYIESLEIPSKAKKIYWDAIIKGFGVCVYPTGRKTYMFRYSLHGKKESMALGDVLNVKFKAAKEAAKTLRARVDLGENPAQDRKDRRAEAAAVRSGPSVADLFHEYMTDYAQHYRSAGTIKGDHSCFRTHIEPNLGGLKVDSIQFSHINKLHKSLEDTPYRANRVFELLYGMFKLALQYGYTDHNPCKGVKKYKEKKRNTFLKPEQIKELVLYLDNHSNRTSAMAIKLMLLTGCRYNEVIQAEWSEFSLEQNTWHIPAGRTKSKRDHKVYLTEEIRAILDEMRAGNDSGYVFFNADTGTYAKRIDKFWYRTRDKLGLKNVRIHDLRHTFASVVISNGYDIKVVKQLLNHQDISSTDRYSHLFQECQEQIAVDISKTITGNVVPFKKTG
tara:strand:+ start:280429 stop:281613 length:1185 start_codon:yes stop_codon:yes gene_type:complete